MPEIIKQRDYVQILEPYVDDGISGETIDERPAMIRLLEDAERGLFDAVFVVDIDRMTRARKSVDWEIIKDSLRKGGVKLVTPGTEYDFDDADQEFMSDLFSRISAYEKKKIMRRMQRGKEEKAKQGKFFGGRVLYGYKYDEDTKNYSIVEEEAKIIRMIYNLSIQGLSILKISQNLNANGIPTPIQVKDYTTNRKSKGWANSSIRRILYDTAYYGEFKRWKYKRVDRNVITMRNREDWITTTIPGIISQEIFTRSQEALASRKVLSKRNSKRQYLLSGLIFCESCGSKMIGECSKGKHELLYYVCNNSRRKHLDKICPIRSVKAPDVEQAIWSEVVSLLNDPKLLKKAILDSKSATINDENRESLQDLLSEKENEQERILDLYQYGKLEKKKLDERIEKLSVEIEHIKKTLETIKETNKVDNRLLTLNELRLTLEADIKTFDFEQKRKILEILLHGKKGVGIFVDKNYSIELRGLIDFAKLNDYNSLGDNSGIANTTY